MDVMTLYGGPRAAFIFLEGDYLERHAEHLRDFLGQLPIVANLVARTA